MDMQSNKKTKYGSKAIFSVDMSAYVDLEPFNDTNGNKKLYDTKTIILYVEGPTDKEFFDHILKANVACSDIGTSNHASNEIRNNCETEEKGNSSENRKKAVKEAILWREDKNKFGVVDRDGDENEELGWNARGVFFTDTYDLETMLMFTDNEWHTRMGIPHEDVKKAIFIAVQLSNIKPALHAVNCKKVSELNSGSKEVEYSKFINDKSDCKISLSMLLTYLFTNESNKERKSLDVIKAMQSSKACKRIISKFSKEGLRLWVDDFAEIDTTTVSLWQAINGHTVLQSLRFVNDEANKKYKPGKDEKIRKFEYALIDAYNYTCFRKTRLYQLMGKEELIDEAKLSQPKVECKAY